jgi:predicted DNA-binding transcriptional regulator YafY
MKIERLVSIIMILLERKMVTASELSKRFEVSVRTIYRDIDSLNRAEIPIVTSPGANGGLGIIDSYKLEKRFFTKTDIATLLIGLQSIQVPNELEISNALAKISSLLSFENMYEIEENSNHIAIDISSWSGTNPYASLIKMIQSSLKEKRILTFTYSDREQSHTIRKVEPYRLIQKNTTWYMEGFCLTRNDFRLFRLSRMFETAMLDEQFTPRPSNIQTPYQFTFPTVPKIATIRITESAREKVIDLFGEECIQQETDWTWIAYIPMHDNSQGYSFILSLGDKCELLEPIEYRSNLKKYIEKINKLYE